MTSYRAMGGGNLLTEGAGVDTSDESSYVLDIYGEIRDIIYERLISDGTIDPVVRNNWCFVE